MKHIWICYRKPHGLNKTEPIPLNMIRWQAIALFCCLCLFLAGCQQTPLKPGQPVNAVPAAGQLYAQTAAQLPPANALPDYAALYQSFLASGQAQQSAIDWRAMQQQLMQTDISQCLSLPWRQWQQQNLLNLAFYRLAMNCYQEHQQQSELKALQAYQSYLRDGILRSGNGKASYSAWRINTFADAHELLSLLGMQTQDYHAVLSSSGNSMHYEVQVYDPADNRLKTVFFDNQRYLHAIDGLPFPFVGLVDGWRKELLPEGAASNPAMMVPLAIALMEENNTAEAEALLLKAVTQGSLQAKVKLAEWCFQPALHLKTSKAQCLGWLTDAADQDYIPALQLLHLLHFKTLIAGKHQPAVTELQAYINERAGPGVAEVQLARYLLQGKLTPRDAAAAITQLLAAAKAGHPDAASFAILAQLEHQQLPAATATAQLKQLAEQGSTTAAYLYVSDLMQQPELNETERQQAQQLLRQAMLSYHPEAFYLYGYGLERRWFAGDSMPANYYYQQAAERFFARAMLRLGNMYSDGELVKADPLQASRWLYLCTRQGIAACAFHVGVMLDDGEGINADPAAAMRFYSFGAEQGYAPALNRLGLLYLFGKGTKADPVKAVELLQQAASKGSASASYYLGLLYFEGQQVSRDLVKARQYFEQAREHPKARYYLENWQQLTAQPAK
ncbi:MAG: sel1 repeat family protein [Rheinheimera sp.]|nr:MAG: sel1 repeat family protein [Rheinheimera sp.]